MSKTHEYSPLRKARIIVGLRETGIKKMRARHAAEIEAKEQELLAARAHLAMIEQEAEAQR